MPLAITIRAYARRRPGADLVGMLFGLPLGLIAIGLIVAADDSCEAMFSVALKMVEFIFMILFISWGALILGTWTSAISGLITLVITPRDDRDRFSRAVRAVETACLAMSLPSVLIILVTLSLYRALSAAGTYVFPDSLQYAPSWPLLDYFGFSQQMPAIDFLNNLIVVSATRAFGIMLCMFCTTFLFSVWAVLPSIASDLGLGEQSARRATSLGNWLSFGYRLLYWSGVIVFMTFPVAITGGLAWQWLVHTGSVSDFDGGTASTLATLAAIILGSASGLLALHGRLGMLALGLRPALDAVLDVDNYLREHPRDTTPRARICCRFVSLLRYLTHWQDTRDSGDYSAIVIVSHSQGTVLTAELLRYLKYYGGADSTLQRFSRTPVYLMTMGCPLRQLYGWRFPHLYAWARHGQVEPAPAAGQFACDSLDDRLPNPAALRVEQWVNLFRSGDYVGRHLWLADRCKYAWGTPDGTPTIPFEDATGLRREYCIGAGGHTRYFDGSSPAVAAEVDRLIAAALGSPKHARSPIGQETLEPYEARLVKQIVEVSSKLLDRNRKPVPRDQHPKTHRCLRATFTICDALPPDLQAGIFQPGHT
ncbi:MAG: hypothetical protein ABSG53_33255, partial [Thermoguttaceae bacterium]